ncbi:MAG TPA: hypothetical protein DCZ07_01170 [Alphaproteobacteria bacterium]|nr:hypothetical protein [Alphaproteobacteria bacterium]
MQPKNVHRLIATTNESQAMHIDFDNRRRTVIKAAQPFALFPQISNHAPNTKLIMKDTKLSIQFGGAAIKHHPLHSTAA